MTNDLSISTTTTDNSEATESVYIARRSPKLPTKERINSKRKPPKISSSTRSNTEEKIECATTDLITIDDALIDLHNPSYDTYPRLLLNQRISVGRFENTINIDTQNKNKDEESYNKSTTVRRSPRLLEQIESRDNESSSNSDASFETRDIDYDHNNEQDRKNMATTNLNVPTTTNTNVPTTTTQFTTIDTNLKGTTDTTTVTNHKDLSTTTTQDGYAAVLGDEVQCLVGGTSEKFVPEPTGEDILTDVINGLRRFKDAVRWKAFHKYLQEEKDKEKQSGTHNTANNTQEEEEQQQTHNHGLKTNLKPTKTNLSVPRADDKIEGFLQKLEKELLTQALDISRCQRMQRKNPIKSRAYNKS